MIAIIDNYDSFTYNIVQLLGELGSNVEVFRNDVITPEELRERQPSQLIISPGPGNPSQAGISKEAIKMLGKEIPVLGICLGHQCIGEVFGGQVIRARRLMHGKTSFIQHDGESIFQDLPNPFEATRYHSLIVAEPLPDELIAIAYSAEGELMGIRHREYPIFGVQFHPESILTPMGKKIIKNFIEINRK